MMRKIAWEIMIAENKVATAEKGLGLPQNEIESHLIIIGLLENLKQKHLDKIKTLFERTEQKK